MIAKAPRPGGAIALVAPASPFDRSAYERGKEILESAGYSTIPGKSIFETEGYLAGPDPVRARDLIDFLLDPEIAAVICIRGGYGSGRLLPWLPFQSLRRTTPKIFLGYSDVTFLHLALLGGAGWATFHGPNLGSMAEVPECAENVLELLAGKREFSWRIAPEQILRHGRARGPIIGGNLTCLVHLLGTPYMPDLAGALLLIEDRGEALYRIDRMMCHLKLAGVLQGLAGILLGDFDSCGDNGKVCDVVMDSVKFFGYPVVKAMPVGHGGRNEVVPLGAVFSLDTHAGIIEMAATGHGA